ncbi:MAG: hypothetical protein ACOC4J_06200 [Bacteroidota bacterium]
MKNKGFRKNEHNKILRRKIKQALKERAEVLPHKHEAVNQYDVCDWKYDAQLDDDNEKLKRK